MRLLPVYSREHCHSVTDPNSLLHHKSNLVGCIVVTPNTTLHNPDEVGVAKPTHAVEGLPTYIHKSSSHFISIIGGWWWILTTVPSFAGKYIVTLPTSH